MQHNRHTVLMFLLTLLVFNMASTEANAEKTHNVVPEDGYVPNKAVAIKIALAVWEPIYGINKIKNEAPYKATLDKAKRDKDIWVVTGSLAKGWKGGVALIHIEKMSGKILRVSHGK